MTKFPSVFLCLLLSLCLCLPPCLALSLGSLNALDSVCLSPEQALGIRLQEGRPGDQSAHSVLGPGSSKDNQFYPLTRSLLPPLPLGQECHKFISGDVNLFVGFVNCKTGLQAVDLKNMKVLKHLERTKGLYFRGKSKELVELLVEIEEAYKWIEFSLSSLEFTGKDTDFDMPLLTKDSFSFRRVYQEKETSYYWSEGTKRANPPYSPNKDTVIAKIDSTNKYELINIDTDQISRVLGIYFKNVHKKNLSEKKLKVLNIRHLYIASNDIVQNPIVLLAVYIQKSFSEEVLEYFYLYGELDKDKKKVSGFKVIPELYLKYPNGVSVLDFQIESSKDSSNPKILKHQLKMQINVRGEDKKFLTGLFYDQLDVSQDTTKEIDDPEREISQSFTKGPSKLDPAFDQIKPEVFPAIKLSKNLKVFGNPISTDIYYVAVEKSNTLTNHYYMESIGVKYIESLDRIVSIKNYGDPGHSKTSVLETFDPSCKVYLSMHTARVTHTFTQPIQYTILKDGKREVKKEEVSFELTRKHEQLERVSNSPSESFLQLGESSSWVRLPFDNKMVTGVYTSLEIKELPSDKYFVKNQQEVSFVNPQGEKLEKMIALEGYALQEKTQSSYIVFKCKTQGFKKITFMCHPTGKKVTIPGRWNLIQQSYNYLSIKYEAKDGKSNQGLMVANLDTINGKGQTYEFCTKSSDFSAVIIGHIVWFATICDAQVKVGSMNILTQAKGKIWTSFHRQSTPKVTCPKRISISNHKNLKLAIYDECDDSKEGSLIDVDLKGASTSNLYPDHRIISSFIDKFDERAFQNICSFEESVVVLMNKDLYLYQTAKEMVTLRIHVQEFGQESSTEIGKIETMHCLENGKILVVSKEKGAILEIEKLDNAKYRPYRSLSGKMLHQLVMVKESDDNLIMTFTNPEDSSFVTEIFSLESPLIYIASDYKENLSEINLKFTDSNGLVVMVPTKIKKENDFDDSLSFKLTHSEEKIPIHPGMLMKVFSQPGLTIAGELQDLKIKGDLSNKIIVKPSIRAKTLVSSGVQTFAADKDSMLYMKESLDKTELILWSPQSETVIHQPKKGVDFCVDSDMVSLDDSEFYCVLSCYNERSSSLLYLASDQGDIRRADLDSHHTDPRVRRLGSNIYLFARVPHQSQVQVFHTPHITDSMNPFKMYNQRNNGNTRNADGKSTRQLFMLYTTDEDYELKALLIHSDSDKQNILKEVKVKGISGAVHSFRCKEQSKPSEKENLSVTCAFSLDGYKILLATVTLTDSMTLEATSILPFKLLNSFTSYKIDFDDRIMVVSGNIHKDASESSNDDVKRGSAVLVYSLALGKKYGKDSKEFKERGQFIAGFLSDSLLSPFNPVPSSSPYFSLTPTNHNLKVLSSDNSGAPLIALKSTDSQLQLYVFNEQGPLLSFGKLSKEETHHSSQLQAIGPNGRVLSYNLDELFEFKSSPKPKPHPDPKPQPDPKPEYITKDENNSFFGSLWFWVISLSIIGFIVVGIYFLRIYLRKEKLTALYKKTDGVDSSGKQETSFNDNSIFTDNKL